MNTGADQAVNRDALEVKDVGCALKLGAVDLGEDVSGGVGRIEGGHSVVVPGSGKR